MGGHCADYGFRFGLQVQLLRKTGQHSTASSCTASGLLRAGIFDSRRQKSEPCEDFCGDSYALIQCAPSISRLPRRNMLRRSCLLRRSKRVGTLLRRDSSSPRLCPCFYHSTLLCICQVAAEKKRQNACRLPGAACYGRIQTAAIMPNSTMLLMTAAGRSRLTFSFTASSPITASAGLSSRYSTPICPPG